MNVAAQDKITFTCKVTDNGEGRYGMCFGMRAAINEEFTIDWGDGVVETKSNAHDVHYHEYDAKGEYSVAIMANSINCKFYGFDDHENGSMLSLDVSGCSVLTEITCYYNHLRSLTVCPSLVSLNCFYNRLTELDLSNCKDLAGLSCDRNELISLKLSERAVLESIYCYDNRLPLSDLYAAHLLIDDINHKRLGTQNLLPQTVVIGKELFSEQSVFDGIFTKYAVTKDETPAPESDYTIKDGKLTFHAAGEYMVTMTNEAIISHESYPAKVIVVLEVREAGTDATLSELSISEGELNPAFDSAIFNYSVNVAYDVSEITITPTPNDSHAIINGDIGVLPLTAGANPFNITVIAEDEVTQKTYSVVVNRTNVGIIEEAETANLHVYPNPTSGELTVDNGQLIVEKIELFDIFGKKVFETNETIFDISHLPAGTYFLRIDETIAKIIKL